jgi:hypothetical protein
LRQQMAKQFLFVVGINLKGLDADIFRRLQRGSECKPRWISTEASRVAEKHRV